MVYVSKLTKGPFMAKRIFTVKKTIGGGLEFRKWADWSVDDVVIGKFVGTYEDKFKNTNYKIQVLDAQFQDADAGEALVGKTLALNSSGSLDKQMEQVQEGEYISCTYGGKVMLTKGPFAGKEAHSMSVSIVEVTEEDLRGTDAL